MADPAAPIPALPSARRRRWPLVALVALICLVAIGFSFFERIAAWAASEVLAAQFGLSSRIEISQIGSNQARIASLSLGTGGQVVVSDLALQFRPTAMAVDRIEIGRIEIHARYDGHAISLGELDPMLRQLMEPGNGGGGPLPTIILHRIDVAIETPIGVISGEGMATIDHGVVYSQFDLSEPAGKMAAHIDINAALDNQNPQPQGKVTLDLRSDSTVWRMLGLPQPTAGAFHFAAQLKAPDNDATSSGIRVATGSLVLATDWNFSGDNLSWPGQAAPLGIQGNGRALLSERRLDLPNFDITASGGWSPDFSAHAKGAGSLNRDAETLAAQTRVNITAQTKAVAVGAIQVRNPAFDLGLQIGFADRRLTIQAGRDGTIKLAQTAIGTALKIAKPVVITVKKGDASRVTVSFNPDDGHLLEGSLVLGALAADIATPSLAASIHLASPGGSLAFAYDPKAPPQYSLDVKNGEVRIAQPEFAAHNVSLALKGEGAKANLILAAAALTGPSGAGPATLDGKAAIDGNKLDFTSKLGFAAAKATLTAKGSYDLASGKGKGDIEMPPVTFAPNALQPRDLVPGLASVMETVSGTVALKGPVTIDKSGVTSQLSLNLQGLSGKFGPVSLKNLNSVIEIDRPWPLTTAADQIVSVELADVGLPLTNGVVHFKIEDGSRLALAQSQLEMMSGHVTLDPVTLQLGAPAQQIKLHVDSVSLANLFQLFAVSGLTGDGILSGEIPVTLFPAGLAIDHAKLVAQAPGKLGYDPSEAPPALANAGDSVKMALSALTDFEYDKLSVDLDRAATGDTVLGLHISGRNPTFYNGYPVEFNLSVTGKLDEALRKGLAGYQVPDMIRERLKSFNH